MRRRGSLAALALALAACAADPLFSSAPRNASALPIAPWSLHEECGTVASGERLSYQFDASEQVGFSLYYRDGGSTVAPVSLAGTRQHSGVYPSHAARRYCLQWEAGAAGALLDYRIRLLPGTSAP